MARRVSGDIVAQAKKLGLFDVLQKLVKQGEKLDDITIDRLRATIRQTDDINWNANSVPSFGHTFTRHGAGNRNASDLAGRAAGTGTPQGQWLDNDQAAAFLRDSYSPGQQKRVVDLPEGMGQMVNPDGTTSPATRALLLPRPSGTYKDAYPVPDDYTM